MFSLEKMPDEAVPYDYTAARTIALLFALGEDEKAIEIAQVLGDRAVEMVEYLARENKDLGFELQRNLIVLAELQRTLYENGQEELAKKYEEAYQRIVADMQLFRGRM